MNQVEHNTTGLWASVRRIADSLLGLAQSRIDLFAVELREEQLRALDLVVWLGLAIALASAGLLVGLGALALFLWAAAGYAGLVGLALAALVAAAGIVLSIRRRIVRGPVPFAETIAEFTKDRECLLSKN
jgi:uncharacterized membrane protein YqjE